MDMDMYTVYKVNSCYYVSKYSIVILIHFCLQALFELPLHPSVVQSIAIENHEHGDLAGIRGIANNLILDCQATELLFMHACNYISYNHIYADICTIFCEHLNYFEKYVNAHCPSYKL